MKTPSILAVLAALSLGALYSPAADACAMAPLELLELEEQPLVAEAEAETPSLEDLFADIDGAAEEVIQPAPPSMGLELELELVLDADEAPVLVADEIKDGKAQPQS